ncbi:MAG TPA: CBS domain-containing protein [Thermoleophilia bacterium]|nr:CBS domain-containing protein [Thermoleophilia bacterium]
MFFLSKLLGSPVRDRDTKSAGTLEDLVVTSRPNYPRVTALLVKRRGRLVVADWSAVESFEETMTMLKVRGAELDERELLDDELPLGKRFLDKQLVDTEGRKVIRVNDIQLVRTGPFVHAVAVDISSGAILRRVGLGRVSDRLTKGRQRPKPHLIDWRVLDLGETDDSGVRLAVPRTKIELLHPADIADIVHELSPEERAAVIGALKDEIAADTLEELHPSYQTSLLLDMPDDRASELLASMSPDDAADLLADLPDERRAHLIAMMEKEDAEDMRELLSYPEDSAGGIMTPDFAWVRLDDTAAEATDKLRTQAEDVETVYYIYVLDRGEHLRGVFSLRDLLMTPPDRKVRDFMTENPVSVPILAGEEEITQAIAKYNLLALPVVDDDNVLHGIITVDDAIDLVLPLAWKKRLPRLFR